MSCGSWSCTLLNNRARSRWGKNKGILSDLTKPLRHLLWWTLLLLSVFLFHSYHSVLWIMQMPMTRRYGTLTSNTFHWTAWRTSLLFKPGGERPAASHLPTSHRHLQVTMGWSQRLQMLNGQCAFTSLSITAQIKPSESYMPFQGFLKDIPFWTLKMDFRY